MTETQKTRALWITIILIGLILRLMGAHGELALDEIWTLSLLKPITSPDQIFWKINHDNNHYLNSLWLYLLGPNAPVLAQRALAIALGVAGVAAAGLWARRHGIMAVLAVMMLFAIGYGMVHYGSEARGYSGLALFTIVAVICCEKVLAGQNRRWALALACLLGMLCHLNFIFLLAIIGVWVAFIETRRQSDLMKAGIASCDAVVPTVLCVAPVIGWIVYQLHLRRFTMGMLNPFDARDFTQSYGLMIRSLTAIPGLDEATTHLALPCLALILAYAWRAELKERLSLYIIGIAVLPVALYMLKIPNTDQPRYFMVSATLYLLLVGDLVGIAWRKGGSFRPVAAVLVAMFIGQNSDFLYHFFTEGRCHYREGVIAMTASGPARYGTDDAFRNNLLVQYYTGRLGVTATYVPQDEWCKSPPDWYLAYTFSHDAPAPTITTGPAACPQSFTAPQAFPYWGMSGFQWNLYRRALDRH